MKNIDDGDALDAMAEFTKEVNMLDKLRCDQIIHFYGAVFIPNKICMVTEFAQYGSLQDLINKRKDNPPSERVRLKMILDGAKGIEYLHANGILHRDIKPDNLLCVSLEENVTVNCKLTDFGSARNLNMLMTNMTFTKGIGSPVYMAPEVLNKQKYKKPSDVYSFAVTIYEVMIWDDAYPKKHFQFPWDIADFVNSGKRPNNQDIIPNKKIEKIVEDSWCQEPRDRLTIHDIVVLFDTEFIKMNVNY